MIPGKAITRNDLWVEYERARMRNGTSILTELNFNLMLLANTRHFSLAFQHVNSWLNEVDDAVRSGVRFRKGELLRQSVVPADDHRACFQVNVFPGKSYQFSVPNSGVNCQRPHIFKLLVGTCVNHPDELFSR
ncbi:Uncharacterised protein [Enterobacter cancerogenus]|uniref:Uncharacterized protein n=1 Tax=Enterobacter cancerogenus TaxID=69218 RepID=A0A484YFG2_9ENTR|nr:Uncharacterised protein [Enterobacter cancerogenus]